MRLSDFEIGQFITYNGSDCDFYGEKLIYIGFSNYTHSIINRTGSIIKIYLNGLLNNDSWDYWRLNREQYNIKLKEIMQEVYKEGYFSCIADNESFIEMITIDEINEKFENWLRNGYNRV